MGTNHKVDSAIRPDIVRVEGEGLSLRRASGMDEDSGPNPPALKKGQELDSLARRFGK